MREWLTCWMIVGERSSTASKLGVGIFVRGGIFVSLFAGSILLLLFCCKDILLLTVFIEGGGFETIIDVVVEFLGDERAPKEVGVVILFSTVSFVVKLRCISSDFFVGRGKFNFLIFSHKEWKCSSNNLCNSCSLSEDKIDLWSLSADSHTIRNSFIVLLKFRTSCKSKFCTLSLVKKRSAISEGPPWTTKFKRMRKNQIKRACILWTFSVCLVCV